MTVFRTYLKILRSYRSVIIMYLSIFLFIALMVGSVGTSSTSFKVSKPSVFIINNDNSKITDSFISYVKESADIIEIESDEESIKDALFYRKVDYIIEIPKNYGEDFISGKDVKIKSISVPNSTSTMYTEMLFNRYFSIYKTYLNNGMTDDQISSLVVKDLESSVDVSLFDTSKKDIDKVCYYYNYTNYTILATCILIIGMITNTFTSMNIKRRNEISPTSYKKINRHLFLGNICLTFAVWLSYVIISFILYKDTMLTTPGLLFIINSFVFSLMALSLGFLIGNLVRSKEAQSGIVNIIALGTSFICGAFVPQEYLGSAVLSFARLLPSYWFITNNNEIALLSNYNFDTIMPIFRNMGIILVSALVFFILTNIVAKKKLKEN